MKLDLPLQGELGIIFTGFHCCNVRYIKLVDSFAQLHLVPQSELSCKNIA